jgi:hypothetical protein
VAVAKRGKTLMRFPCRVLINSRLDSSLYRYPLVGVHEKKEADLGLPQQQGAAAVEALNQLRTNNMLSECIGKLQKFRSCVVFLRI